MQTMTAPQALDQIGRQAERIKSDATQRFSEAASAGDTHRQGDVYVTRIASLPRGCKRIDKPSLQLAPGNTQGSRHCLDSLDGVAIYSDEDAGKLDGPILLTTSERTITHPEHGDLALPPGCYQIGYQRDLDAQERERRVLD